MVVGGISIFGGDVARIAIWIFDGDVARIVVVFLKFDDGSIVW